MLYVQFALIVGGNPVAADHVIERDRRQENRDRQKSHDGSMIQRPHHEPAVSPRHPGKKSGLFGAVSCVLCHGILFAFFFTGDALEHQRTHHRRQRERDKHGNHD